jgi:hypothetical protein
MKTIFLFIFTFFLFESAPVFAYRSLSLDGDNRDYKCGFPNALFKTIKNKENLVSAISNLNFSPDCLDPDQKRFIENTDNAVSGILFGLSGSISKSLGIEGGAELVLTIYDRHTIMAGLVKYAGGGVYVSLPFGASPVYGVLHGDCNSIEKYLGNFHTFSLLGFNKSFGAKNELQDLELSKCDASSNTDGFSMSIVGYSVTKYKQASEFILLKGERVEQLIEFVDQYHPVLK